MTSLAPSLVRRSALAASSRLQGCAARTGSSMATSFSRQYSSACRRESSTSTPLKLSARIEKPARPFSSTASRSNSSGRSTVKDPEPQTGLYYHPTQISVSRGDSESSSIVDGWAISFLPKPSSSEDAVIAFILPTNTSSSQDAEPADFVRANPDRIRINPAGWKIMHDVLKNEVVPNDDLLKFEASTRESGWAHLTDLRHPLMPGRIATPENIIASVAFTEGELNVESYEENKSYRLVTGYEGPIQMADGWIEKLRRRFESL